MLQILFSFWTWPLFQVTCVHFRGVPHDQPMRLTWLAYRFGGLRQGALGVFFVLVCVWRVGGVETKSWKRYEIHGDTWRNCCMFVYHVVLQVHCKSSFIVHHEEIQRSLQQCFPVGLNAQPSVQPIITIIAIIITTTMHGHNCHCSVIQHQESLSIYANGVSRIDVPSTSTPNQLSFIIYINLVYL